MTPPTVRGGTVRREAVATSSVCPVALLAIMLSCMLTHEMLLKLSLCLEQHVLGLASPGDRTAIRTQCSTG
jgi:hypothetical protein